MKLLADLRAASQLKSLTDFTTGSIYDPISQQFCQATVGVPTWAQTRKGWGVNSTGVANITGLTLANAASLQLNTCTLFVAAQHDRVDPVAYHTLFGKQNAYLLFLNPTTQTFVVLDPTGGSYQNSGISPRRGVPHLYVATIVSGQTGGLAMYVDGSFGAFGTVTVLNHASYWVYGCYTASANNNLQGSVLTAGVVNRVLSASEVGRLYDEWMDVGFVSDTSTRMFFGPWSTSMSDAEYNRQGVVLDTDLVRQPNGQTRDMVGSYPGTITNILVPGPDGTGGTFAVNTQVTHAAVLPISQAPACSIVMDTRNPASFTAGRYALQASNGVADSLYWLMIPGGALWPRVQLTVGGVAAYGEPTANVLRAGVRQHVVSVFNGPGATNADRLKIYVDGEQQVLNFSGNIPALMPTLTAAFAQGLNPISHIHTCNQLQVRTTAMSAANVRDEYVRWAQNVDWQAAGEDVPVSLVVSVASPQYIGSWRVVAGTWKVSEDSAGKRWLECVTAGTILIPAPSLLMFGTHTFTVVKAQQPVVTRLSVLTGESAVGGGVAGQNGYCTELDANLAVAMSRVTAGVVALNVFITANGFVALAKPYTFVVARRPSDCRFSQWIKGGAYPDFRATAGPGTEASYFTCSWLHFQGGAGDKLLINDPPRPGACICHFRGQLNPTLNEVLT